MCAVDENDRVSRIERAPYGVIYVIAYVPWSPISIYPCPWNTMKVRLTGFTPGAIRRRDRNTYGAELVEYIWDKLERT